MDTAFKVRYKMDLMVNEDDVKKGAKEIKNNPIGPSIEIRGTAKEVKDRICHEIDKAVFKLEDLYYGEEF